VDGDGRSNFAILPTGLLLDPTLNDVDVRVYALADDKASKSGIAHLTHQQLADQLGVRRQTIAASLARLEAGDWIEQPRRGRIVVKNAARERTRASTPTPTPSPHEYPVPQRTSVERPIQHRAEAHSTSSERSPRGPFNIDPGDDR
jgi:DNA-binding transcriptional MocR family regulator